MASVNAKDVQCTFGIYKGWFWMLNIGIHVQDLRCIDRVWNMYCTLQTLKLKVYGWDKNCGIEVVYDRKGDLGYHEHQIVTDRAILILH